MNNFFIDEQFFAHLGELIDYFEWTHEDIQDLDDLYFREVQLCNLEKMMVFTDLDIADAVEAWAEIHYDERFSEEPDHQFKALNEAVLKGIDVDKINDAIPSYLYPIREYTKIKKADLLNYFETQKP